MCDWGLQEAEGARVALSVAEALADAAMEAETLHRYHLTRKLDLTFQKPFTSVT